VFSGAVLCATLMIVTGDRARRQETPDLATEEEPDGLRGADSPAEDSRYDDGRRQVKVQAAPLAKVKRARGATRR
jgi:hypothetical protein